MRPQLSAIPKAIKRLMSQNQHHIAKSINLAVKPEALSREIQKFLRCNLENTIQIESTFRKSDIPLLHRAIELVYPGAKLVRQSPYPRLQRFTTACSSEMVEFSDGSQRAMVVEGFLFYELNDGRRRIVLFRDFGRDGILLATLCCKDESEELQSEIIQIESLAKSLPHQLQFQAIRPSGKIIRQAEPVDLNDVALPADVKAELIRNTVGFLKRQSTYQHWGIPLTRGIILHGPPGNGKTLIGRALASMKVATYIEVTTEDLAREPGVKSVFTLARRLAPTILFLEDIDFFAGSNNRRFGNSNFGELLVQLDGVEQNDGVIIIATTNNLSAIDSAISDRPNRFDVVLKIENPGLAERSQIIKRHLGYRIEDVLDFAANWTEGFSGAKVRETCIMACMVAIESNGEEESVTNQHFREALRKTHFSKGDSPIGFLPTSKRRFVESI